MVLEDLSRGDRLTVYDATKREVVAEILVPDQKAFDHKRVRERQFSKYLAAFGFYLKMAHGSGDGAPYMSVPAFLEFLATHHRDGGGSVEPLHVLVIGSAVNRDPKHPDLAFDDGYFPSDGHIRASRRESPFGTAEMGGFLKSVSVHFLYTDAESVWTNPLHKRRVWRFWHMLVKAQGGSMPSFNSDPVTAFKRLTNRNATPRYDFSYDGTVNKVTMLRARRRLDIGFLDDHPWLGENAIIETTPPPSVIGQLKLGIRWPCIRCNIDIYTRSSTDSEWLYFGNTRTDDGMFYKDWQESPDTVNGLEVIEFFFRC